MYSRKIDCEIFYDRRESVISTKSSMESDYGSSGDGSTSSDHYNPTLRLLQIPRSSNGSMGFHLTRSKWDPYPWISAVDTNTTAKFYGLKAGECVLEVNGEDVLGMRLSEVANLVNSGSKIFDNVALLLWSPGSDIKCNPMNLCCGPMPLNLERLTACTQTILAIIECPVCLETIAPPALQCQNGHILCVKCRILSHTCPVCRQHFYPGRSLVAEQIYNSVMDTFNLRNPDKLQRTDGQQLFGAKYRRSSSISMAKSTSSSPMEERRRREKQQYHGIHLKHPSHEVNKFGSPPPTTNKFLAKLLGRAYSMDNLSSPRCRQSASLLSVTRIISGRVATDGGSVLDGERDDFDNDDHGKANSNDDDSDEQLEFGNLFRKAFKLRPATISKQLSLSAHDLSKIDNEGIMAMQHECLSNNGLRHLWLERNTVQMSLLPVPSFQQCPTATLGPQKISVDSGKHLKDGLPLESTNKTSCCTVPPVYFCPLSCGKQLSGPNLQQHIKVDHCVPILCYNSSSAELALPLRAPLDKAAILLMCHGKDFWIKLRTHGEGSITALALFQGPEDESSEFMLETRLRNRIVKDQTDDDNNYDVDVANEDNHGHVKIFVNKEDGILEQELITRSIVRSMIVTSWEETYSYVADGGGIVNVEKDEKSRGFLYNQEKIRLTFGKAIDYHNLLLKIIIKRI